MDTSSNARKPVSLGECVCDAHLCGRYSTGGLVVTACGLEAIHVSSTDKSIEKFNEAREVLRGWGVW